MGKGCGFPSFPTRTQKGLEIGVDFEPLAGEAP
jgi:hypothetical protein